MAIYFAMGVPESGPMSADKRRGLKHNFQGLPEGAGWTTSTACSQGCLARASWVCAAASLGAFAASPYAVAVELFRDSKKKLHREFLLLFSFFFSDKVGCRLDSTAFFYQKTKGCSSFSFFICSLRPTLTTIFTRQIRRYSY